MREKMDVLSLSSAQAQCTHRPLHCKDNDTPGHALGSWTRESSQPGWASEADEVVTGVLYPS